MIEEVDAIIDKGGATVFAEIQGYVRNILQSIIKLIFRLIILKKVLYFLNINSPFIIF